jgi:hypothetical protein
MSLMRRCQEQSGNNDRGTCSYCSELVLPIWTNLLMAVRSSVAGLETSPNHPLVHLPSNASAFQRRFHPWDDNKLPWPSRAKEVVATVPQYRHRTSQTL